MPQVAGVVRRKQAIDVCRACWDDGMIVDVSEAATACCYWPDDEGERKERSC